MPEKYAKNTVNLFLNFSANDSSRSQFFENGTGLEQGPVWSATHVQLYAYSCIQLDELMVYSKSLELKESKYEASLMKTL